MGRTWLALTLTGALTLALGLGSFGCEADRSGDEPASPPAQEPEPGSPPPEEPASPEDQDEPGSPEEQDEPGSPDEQDEPGSPEPEHDEPGSP